MAKYLFDKGLIPQHLISSPANRAITTARFFADKFDFPRKNIQIDARIYNADKFELLEVIRSLDNTYDTVALFGHDTSITVVTEELSNQRFLHFPTCGVAGIKLNINSWGEAADGCGELLFFYFPKGVKEEQNGLKSASKE